MRGGRPRSPFGRTPNPPHRQAVCLEPYTCVTDAVNLQQNGVAAGWKVLPPGERWQADLELAVEA